MNIARTLDQIKAERKSSTSAQVINGTIVERIWTKFYFDEKKLLCFDILLDLKGGKTVSFQKLKDYSTYKKVLNHLHVARSEKTVITIPEDTDNYNRFA